jgi:hypothetical protein
MQARQKRRVAECAGWYYFANLSTVSVCLPVHTVTKKTHTLTRTTNTNTHPSDESPAKTPGDRVDNWFVCN